MADFRDIHDDHRRGCSTGTTAERLRRHIRNRHGVHGGSYGRALDAANPQYTATTTKES